jgi:translation initiation factor 3 subunit H
MHQDGENYHEENYHGREVPNQPIKEVIIDGLAVLKIVKHCNDSLPSLVAGSLLGLDVDGRLEITYSYSFPIPRENNGQKGDGVEELDGNEYQIEMMKMLRDVNVDNNCVGWYQSMFLGTICTNDVVGYQYSYQSSEELSNNSVVIMYDPIQSQKGILVLKAFRLTDKFMELKRTNANQFIRPSEILEELPLKIRNVGHVSAFLRCLEDSHKNELDCDFDPLSMNKEEVYAEKHLELLTSMLDDLVGEQIRFQKYSQSIAKTRQEHIRWLMKRVQDNIEARDAGDYEMSTSLQESGLKPLYDAPPRNDPLILMGQIDRYCKQVNEHVDGSIHKLLLTSKLNSASL